MHKSKTRGTWPRGYKTFFMLSSAETKIYPAHKINVKMPITFISRINYRLWSSEPSISLFLGYSSIFEELKFQAQLS